MSMISPESYINELKDASYDQLIAERNELLSYITDFEEKKIPESAWDICPQPEVRYQLYLEYLGLLCKRIAEVYNRGVMWGGKEQD